jgi:hypothetical protein
LTAAWTRDQFWQYAAFFAELGRGRNARSIVIPAAGKNPSKTVSARFLDDTEPKFKDGVSARATLADWVTAPDNKYFARAAVNRVWGYFFGSGLVEPVDDLTQEPDGNRLLDTLAKQFVESGYDLKALIAAVANSKPYHLSSTASHSSQDDPRLFARMAVRGLMPEQIFDSLVEATGWQAVPFGARARFLARFSNAADKATEQETSILQALSLMNGKLVDEATTLSRSELLAAVTEAPFLDTKAKIETLYLAALARKPRPAESERLVKYVDKGGPSGDRKQALADVFWAVLNSGEFLLNH